jgi:hypothetical protein
LIDNAHPKLFRHFKCFWFRQFNKSGVYKLTGKTCQHSYIGQTSRNQKQRYQEHIRYIKNNNPQSAYAQHILNNRHQYGTIDEIMKLVKLTTQTSLLIPYESLFTQVHQQGQLIAEQTTGETNPLFQLYLDTTQKYPTNRSIPTDTPLKTSLQDSAADRQQHRYVP